MDEHNLIGIWVLKGANGTQRKMKPTSIDQAGSEGPQRYSKMDGRPILPSSKSTGINSTEDSSADITNSKFLFILAFASHRARLKKRVKVSQPRPSLTAESAHFTSLLPIPKKPNPSGQGALIFMHFQH